MNEKIFANITYIEKTYRKTCHFTLNRPFIYHNFFITLLCMYATCTFDGDFSPGKTFLMILDKTDLFEFSFVGLKRFCFSSNLKFQMVELFLIGGVHFPQTLKTSPPLLERSTCPEPSVVFSLSIRGIYNLFKLFRFNLF